MSSQGAQPKRQGGARRSCSSPKPEISTTSSGSEGQQDSSGYDPQSTEDGAGCQGNCAARSGRCHVAQRTSRHLRTKKAQNREGSQRERPALLDYVRFHPFHRFLHRVLNLLDDLFHLNGAKTTYAQEELLEGGVDLIDLANIADEDDVDFE